VPIVRATHPGDLVLAAPALALLVAVQATPAIDTTTLAAIVGDGIRRGAFPGAAVAVGTADSLLFVGGFGHLAWSEASPPVDPERTLYDVASLTKVVATTTAIMILSDRGRVDLDARVSRYVPEFDHPETGAITVRELLTHTSGLPADLPIAAIRGAADSTALLRLVYAATPQVPPGTRVVYSDLNAVLLGEVVRRAGGETLDRFAAREIFAPLGMRETQFRPSARLRSRIAPTGVWHGRPVAGVVNDPSAAKLGGVSGNAGLFSTARDLARFAQFILRGGVAPDGRRLVRAETVHRFTTRAAYFGAEARALGWQAVPTGERVSSAGSRFGPHSVGHTGWTGTSLWIDPDRGVFVVLLTNRAYAPRNARSFSVLKEIRGRLADAVAEARDAAAR
jgi:CubicO group peptidase (beta-lactamase class C family)